VKSRTPERKKNKGKGEKKGAYSGKKKKNLSSVSQAVCETIVTQVVTKKKKRTQRKNHQVTTLTEKKVRTTRGGLLAALNKILGSTSKMAMAGLWGKILHCELKGRGGKKKGPRDLSIYQGLTFQEERRERAARQPTPDSRHR